MIAFAPHSRAIEADQAPEALAGMGAAMVQGSYVPAMELASEIVDQSVRDNFTSSASPDGSDWPPRKRIGDGHPLLIDTGALLQAATDGGSGHIERLEPRGLVKGVQGGVVPYAAVHNYGGLVMPQREFMGLHDRGEQAVSELLADFVTQELWG